MKKLQATTIARSLLASTALFFANPTLIFAASQNALPDDSSAHSLGITFLYLAIIIFAAKLGGIVQKLDIPDVLGEITAGIVLSAFSLLGLGIIDQMRHDIILAFMAELGAVLLLFQVGLESNLKEILKVGPKAVIIAIIGAVLPFMSGAFWLGPWLFPSANQVAHLFIGASLVATSVGISAVIFQQLRATKTLIFKTVLGAAVIDDVLGLIILAVVSALASGGTVTPQIVAWLFAKALLFLAISIGLGQLLARPLSKMFSKISTGTGMKLTVALTFALVYAYVATLVGLAPIVGAFAAGLILDAVHFNSFDLPPIAHDLTRLRSLSDKAVEKIDHLIHKHQHAHVEDLIKNLGLLLVPIFFVYTGLQVEVSSLLDPSVYITATIISVVAVVTKLIAGIGASGSIKEKLAVGASMVPRGEVGLIFASVGKQLGVLPENVFSTIILVILATTVVGPLLIKKALSQQE